MGEYRGAVGVGSGGWLYVRLASGLTATAATIESALSRLDWSKRETYLENAVLKSALPPAGTISITLANGTELFSLTPLEGCEDDAASLLEYLVTVGAATRDDVESVLAKMAPATSFSI